MTAIERLLRDAEGDVLEDLLAAVDRHRQVAGREGDLTGVDELLEPVADEAERRVADADDVVRAEQRGAGLGDRLTVDVRAVVGAEVADLEAAVGRRVELGVVARDLEVGDDQFVLQRTADAHHAAERELVERGRAAVAVDRRRPRAPPGPRRPAGAGCCACCGCCRLLLRGLPAAAGAAAGAAAAAAGPAAACGCWRRLRRGACCGPAAAAAALRRRRRCAAEVQPRSVGRVAEVHGEPGPISIWWIRWPCTIGAVGAAVVLDDPTAAAPADRGVPPRHPGVVDHQVALRITSEGVRPGRIERPGPSIQFQYEFRHSMPH